MHLGLILNSPSTYLPTAPFRLAQGFTQWNPIVYLAPLFISLIAILSALFSTILLEYWRFQILRSGLKLADHQKPDWKIIFEANNFITYFWARMWFLIKIFIGFIFFIIPGIYLYCKYIFTGYTIADEKADSISKDKDIVQSLTVGVRWKIFFFELLSLTLETVLPALIFLLGTLLSFNYLTRVGQEAAPASPALVGTFIIVTWIVNLIVDGFLIPIVILARVHIYEQLQNYFEKTSALTK